MTSSLESLTTLPNQHLQDAQNHAARKAMHLSGVLYEGQTLDGKTDSPTNAVLRNIEHIQKYPECVKLLIEAGII